MDTIKERLETTSQECLKCLDGWSENQKDTAAREALSSAIHELRKVASRLEIELALSERDQMAKKPSLRSSQVSHQARSQSEIADEAGAGASGGGRSSRSGRRRSSSGGGSGRRGSSSGNKSSDS